MNTRNVGKRTSGAMIAMAVFFVNPLWIIACIGASEPTPLNYSADDMEKELSEAARTYSVSGDAGSFEVTFAVKGLDAMAMIEPPAVSAFLQEASACGGFDHEFVAGANACAGPQDGASMTFDSTVTVTWAPAEGEPVVLAEGVSAEGYYEVASVDLNTGVIWMSDFASKDGAKISLRLDTEDGDGANFTLQNVTFSDVPADAEGYGHELLGGEVTSVE